MKEFDLLLEKVIDIINDSGINHKDMYIYEGDPEALAESFTTDTKYGLSKIVFPDISDKYVIKLPTIGTMDSVWDEEIEGFKTDEDGEEVTIKQEYTDDYCGRETKIYQKAINVGVAEAFAGEWCIGTVNGISVYCQEKANNIGDSTSKVTPEEIDEFMEKEKYHYPHIESCAFMIDLLNYYGEEKFLELLNFLKSECIGDLHDGNIGYIGSRPVFVDYSGFNG